MLTVVLVDRCYAEVTLERRSTIGLICNKWRRYTVKFLFGACMRAFDAICMLPKSCVCIRLIIRRNEKTRAV